MLSTLSATEVAFLMAALTQAVASIAWALGAWVVPVERRAAGHWAAYAALSSLTWYILAERLQSPPLIGVVAGVAAAMLLRRGIRVFIGRPTAIREPALLMAAVLLAAWAGPHFEARHLPAVVNFAVLAGLFFGMARDLYLHARGELRMRWPVLLSLPVLLGGLAFAARSLQALLRPDSVALEMSTNSTLNVGSALSYVVLVLALHASLMALVVARLTRELQRLSRHDGLTGLLNRRAMQIVLDEQIRRSRRTGEAFAVLMLDLDHFKAINDRHGHAAGDLALKRVSTALTSALRDVDRVARFGGEEFLVLLPGLAMSDAAVVAERLREAVAAVSIEHEAGRIPLAVSIGVAEWNAAGEDSSRVIVRADVALYEAKGQGRGRVVLAASGPPTGSMQPA